MEYKVRHRTTYRYLQDVSHSWHLAHLRLRTTPQQTVHDSKISLSLEPQARWRATIISTIPANGFPSTSRTPIWT
jgi:transglutaminase-like putative cysteine protease